MKSSYAPFTLQEINGLKLSVRFNSHMKYFKQQVEKEDTTEGKTKLKSLNTMML